MEKFVIKAAPRTVTGKQVKQLRRESKIPAVLYGRHIDAIPLTLDLHDASLTLAHMTSSSLVTIDLDGKEYPSLVREKQRDFIRGTILHVDFQAVSLTEKLKTNVSIELHGVAPAIKDFDGIQMGGIDEVEVECFPQDLPDRIIVDVSTLKQIGDGIYVRDLSVSDKVSILESPDEMIVIITAAAKEEVEEVAVAEGEEGEAEPEIIERGKKEEGEEES